METHNLNPITGMQLEQQDTSFIVPCMTVKLPVVCYFFLSSKENDGCQNQSREFRCIKSSPPLLTSACLLNGLLIQPETWHSKVCSSLL